MLIALLLSCRPGPPPAPVVPEPPSDTDAVVTDTDTDTEPQPELTDATVLLVSLDGYRWDYIDRATTPVLDRLAEEGVQAQSLMSVFPSKTFPSHYTQVTGLYPPQHGIVDNSFWDPELNGWFSMGETDPRWWHGEPIWVTAEKAGLKAATLFWPGSDVAIDGVRPTHWLPFDGSMRYTDRVEQVLTWLDEPERPHFLTLYMSSVDHEGHTHGPSGPEVEAAAADVDGYLAQLVDGLEQRELLNVVDLIVVSDHGMTGLDRSRAVFLDDYIDIEASWVRSWSAVSGIEPYAGGTDAVLQQLEAADHLQCARSEELPERFHYSGSVRIPPVVCWAELGWYITSREWFEEHPTAGTGGTHGFDPAELDMHGIFVARGPHFRQGWSHPSFASVHLYPLLAHLLELQPAAQEGDLEVTRDMLRSEE